MIQRRVILGLVATHLASPMASRGQTNRSKPRIALVWGMTPVREMTGADPIDPGVRGFVHGLEALGMRVGRDIDLEYRSAEGRVDRVPSLIADLLQQRVDVIVSTIPHFVAKETESIPIVGITFDFEEMGLSRSLAHPEKNVTGLAIGAASDTKRLQLLRDLLPTASRVAVLSPQIGSKPKPNAEYRAHLEAAARALSLELLFVDVELAAGTLPDFTPVVKRRAEAILLSPEMQSFYGTQIVDFSQVHRLPTVAELRGHGGALVTYGPNLPKVLGRAAWYVARLLEGQKPSDLPIEQTSSLELVIDLRRAREIGVVVPALLRIQADEVIE